MNLPVRLKISAAAGVAAMLISVSSFAGPVALTVRVMAVSGCGPSSDLRISTESIRAIAAEAFQKKGYNVVQDFQQVPGGLEAVVDFRYCQNVEGGQIVGFAGTLGMYGISNGTSAVSTGKRVAFNYGYAFFAYGGDAINEQEGKIRASLQSNLVAWINKTF